MPEMNNQATTSHSARFEKCSSCGRFAFPEGAIYVPAEEYELLKAKAAAADLGNIKNYRKLSGTRIARTPEYADFILAALPTMTVTETLRFFERKFGVGVISRSQLYRFAQDMGLTRNR